MHGIKIVSIRANPRTEYPILRCREEAGGMFKLDCAVALEQAQRAQAGIQQTEEYLSHDPVGTLTDEVKRVCEENEAFFSGHLVAQAYAEKKQSLRKHLSGQRRWIEDLITRINLVGYAFGKGILRYDDPLLQELVVDCRDKLTLPCRRLPAMRRC